jgi:site-specific DNA-adenine methylase
MSAELKAPFTYFGGKRPVARTVWERLGDVRCYVEPFAGSCAVLLARPHYPFDDGRKRTECVNDLSARLTNAWRAIREAPDEVARWADFPVHENELIARYAWNNKEGVERTRRCREDMDYYDARAAGIWLYGMCHCVGGGWDVEKKTPGRRELMMSNNSPDRGVYRVGKKMPCAHPGGRIATAGAEKAGPDDCAVRHAAIVAEMHRLCDRLRGVRVCCGDWARVLTPAVTIYIGHPVGVFLDPPYLMDDEEDRGKVYAHDDGAVASAVCEWCAANGADTRFRIALCGYEGHYQLPGWSCYRWKATGGYGNQKKTGVPNENRGRERIWFSPHCLVPRQMELFAADNEEDGLEEAVDEQERTTVMAPGEQAALAPAGAVPEDLVPADDPEDESVGGGGGRGDTGAPEVDPTPATATAGDEGGLL